MELKGAFVGIEPVFATADDLLCISSSMLNETTRVLTCGLKTGKHAGSMIRREKRVKYRSLTDWLQTSSALPDSGSSRLRRSFEMRFRAIGI